MNEINFEWYPEYSTYDFYTGYTLRVEGTAMGDWFFEIFDQCDKPIYDSVTFGDYQGKGFWDLETAKTFCIQKYKEIIELKNKEQQ